MSAITIHGSDFRMRCYTMGPSGISHHASFSPRSLRWMRTAPPIERRHKLWKLRSFLLHGPRAPFCSPAPYLPRVRGPHQRREIHLVRDQDDYE